MVKLKKGLISLIIGFSLITTLSLMSCDNPDATKNDNPNNTEQTDTDNQKEKTDSDKESEKESDKKDDNKSEEKKTDDNESNESENKSEENKTVTYTVTFVTNGGSKVDSQTVKPNEKVTKPANNPTKDNCTFGGWYSDKECTKEFNFETAITANVSVYAKWTMAEGYFKVEFINTDLTWQSIKSGEKVTRPADDPEKTGSKFAGWFSDADCTTAFDFNTAITANTKIYAKWQVVGSISGSGINVSVEENEIFIITKNGNTYSVPEGYDSYQWCFDNGFTTEGVDFYPITIGNTNSITITSLPDGIPQRANKKYLLWVLAEKNQKDFIDSMTITVE